jgi:hypothetical protein
MDEQIRAVLADSAAVHIKVEQLCEAVERFIVHGTGEEDLAGAVLAVREELKKEKP